MKAAVEHAFNGQTTGSYDSTKTVLASLIKQYSGSNVEDNYVSPKASAMINIQDAATATPGVQHMPHVIKWSDNKYYIFTTTTAAAAINRNIALFEFDSDISVLNYKGFINLTGNLTGGTKTIRSFRALMYRHTTGTVSTSGTSNVITGSGTGFVSEGIAAGARIGFNTTSSAQVNTWYDIQSITSDTELIINGSENLSPSTPYVIEEIRIAAGVTNASVALGGLYLVKGLNIDTFTFGGTNINDATTIDNVRAAYLLQDAFPSGEGRPIVTWSGVSGSMYLPNHGLNINDSVYFTSSATLPSGLAASTPYYVTNIGLTQDRFSLATTINSATTQSVFTSGSGTHYIYMGTNKHTATIAVDEPISNNEHYIYLVNAGNAAANILACSISKYNVRAPLTVGSLLPAGPPSGSSASAFSGSTSLAVHQGTISQLNSGRIFTVNHGTAAGDKSLWFVTTSTNQRIYRCPISNIFDGSTSFLYEQMPENPPGTLNTFPLLNTFSQLDYSSTIDRILVTNGGLGSTYVSRWPIYVTQFETSGNTQFERIVGGNINRLKSSLTDQGATNALFPQGPLTIWTEDGWMFAIPSTLTATHNWLYTFPMGVEAGYNSTSNQHIITPKLATPGATKLYRAYVDHQEYLGASGLGFPLESYRLWYRTSGIDDNSGAWTEIQPGNSLTNITPGDYIQFKIAFDILGEFCVPTRIYSISCTYEDGSQDSHYEPSLTKSSAQNRQFAWRQIVGWGSNIPNLRLRLFNVANDATVLDDDTDTNAYGTWEYSTNGTNWVAWDDTQDTIGNYIRYTANDNVIGNGITVRALLTQA